MLNHMTNEQKRIHERAKVAGRNHARAEWEAIEALRDVHRENVHRLMGKRNLYAYAVEEMGLSEGTAYAMAAIAKKTFEIAEILPAITAGRVSANKMNRMLSVLTKENAGELIEFASGSTTKELDFKVASINPMPKRRTSVRAVAGDRVRVAMDLTTEEYAVMERARELLAGQGMSDMKDVVLAVAREYVDRHDPVAKAARAADRKLKVSKPTVTNPAIKEMPPVEHVALQTDSQVRPLHKSSPTKFMRKPLTAVERHSVNRRDKGQCTFIDGQGKRCAERMHTQTHHIIPVSRGGSNDPSNLTTLCWFHHDLVHQLSFPIEGQVSWIREPQKAYVA